MNRLLESFNDARMVIAWGGVRRHGNEKFEEVEVVIKMHVWKKGSF